MNFNIDQDAFPSAVHSLIYFTARGIIPLEQSLADIADSDMRVSCMAFHGFVMAMLADMYDNPVEYHLPVMLLEDFCEGRKINGLKQKYPSKAKNVIARTRNAVNNYIELLYKLGTYGETSGETLVFSSEALDKYDKTLKGSVRSICVADMFKAMARVGITVRENEVTSKEYPTMFPALCALSRLARTNSGFDFFAFRTLDFRNLNGRHKPAYKDYFRPLTEMQKKQAYALQDFAASRKMKPTISTFWKVDYKYKGSQVMCIGSEWNLGEMALDIRVMGTYHWDDPSLINDRLAQESPDFQKNILRHILRCTACSTTHLGMFVTVLGKKQRVCGGGAIAFRWKNPDDEDMAVIKRVIELRCGIIDEQKKGGN